MTKTIPATVAGRFYPSDAGQLRSEIQAYLQAAPAVGTPKAIIAPHAGYDYSGRVAGHAYRSVQSVSPHIREVLLLGTCHVRGVHGLITTSAADLATPLGRVPVDRNAIDLAHATLSESIVVNDAAHAADHALQTQLPFLQVVLDKFAVFPFLVGAADESQVATLIAALGKSREVLVVVSSDLSHYLEYDACNRIDRQTAASIVAMDAESIGPDQACGYHAIRGLIRVAASQRWTARVLALQNSGDTSGDRTRVVGYGAFAMEASED